jgi:ketosteroid isomerase-like protein
MHKLHRALLILALTLSALHIKAQQPDQLFTATRLQLDVTKALLAQESAWNRGDLDAYLNFYKNAPDTQAILGAPLRGLPAIRARFHTSFPTRDTMGNLEQSQVDVRAMGETFALATGAYHLTRPRKAGGDVDGTFIDIFEKTPTGWQIIFTETT